MIVHIHSVHYPHHDSIEELVHQEIDKAIGPFASQITHVEVHLNDVNGPKAGVDKRCLIEAHIPGRPPVAVSHEASNMPEALHLSAEKLKKIIRNLIERRREKKGQTSAAKSFPYESPRFPIS